MSSQATQSCAKDLWVFAYGSLMWRPDFAFSEVRPALLRGYHRALCIYSHVYRGTPKRPGLVLGLDFGGSCRGRVFRVENGIAEDVLAAIDEREISYSVYVRRRVPVAFLDRPREPRFAAHAYVVDRRGPQYARNLPLGRIVELIRQGRGQTGTSREYLENTVRHLDELGIPDKRLHEVLRAVRGHA